MVVKLGLSSVARMAAYLAAQMVGMMAACSAARLIVLMDYLKDAWMVLTAARSDARSADTKVGWKVGCWASLMLAKMVLNLVGMMAVCSAAHSMALVMVCV